MKRFICWYAYKGMETEGGLALEEPKIVKANSIGEAMWIWNTKYRDIDMKGIYGSYEAYLKKGEFTGWGHWCEELAQ